VHSAATQLPLFTQADEPDSMSGFCVRESGRAKRLSIKVFPRGRVEVVVPLRTKPAVVREFVEAHRDWIQKARAQFAADHPPEPFALPNVVELNGIERRFEVLYQPEDGAKTVKYRPGAEQLVLSGRTSDEKLCVEALKRWLGSVARAECEPAGVAIPVPAPSV